MLIKFAIKDFLEDREFRGLSPVTIKGYGGTLKEFHNMCAEKGIVNVADVTPSTIKSYLLHCKKVRGNNPTSVNHKLHNLKIFFNYLEDNEVISIRGNPIKKISFVKEDIQINVFTDEQVKQMLNYYQRMKYRNKTLYAYRDYMIILTLISTGIRLGELVNLKWNDIDLKNNIITIFGKKRQQSSMPITDKFNKELCEYKVFIEQHFKKMPESVFTTIKGEQLTDNGVKCVFKRLKNVMGWKNVRVSAHTCRHYYAIKMIQNGADAFTVQKMLRHSDLRMTMRYVNMFGATLKEQNEKYNPLNNLDI